MQSSNMFPASQTRHGQVQGNQGQGQYHPPVVPTYSPYHSAPQVHQVGQQVFSAPQQSSSNQFPPVVQQYSAQSFPTVQPSYPNVHQFPQPTHYSAQPLQQQPYVFGQGQGSGQGPLFQAAKDRR